MRPSDLMDNPDKLAGMDEMTIQDYFAIHCRGPNESEHKHMREMDHQRTLNDRSRMRRDRESAELEAEWRYKFAQAMLTERARRQSDDRD